MANLPLPRGARARPGVALACLAGACAAMLAMEFSPADAATATLTLQPGPSTTDDSYLREDNVDENRWDDPSLRIKVEGAAKHRHTVVRIPLSGLTGRSVLRAWLELRQSAANNATPIDARVFPLTESWDEREVTWTRRDMLLILGTPWATPGGTHGAAWSDRVLTSTTTNNTTVQWQVGPVVQAWNAGWMPNHGFVIEPVRGGPNREVSFHSSDYGTATLRPRLVIQYTDQAPSVRQGSAEIQPRSVRIGATGAPLTAWLDADATGSTPSGSATGFDALIVSHGGDLSVTAVDRLVVGGASIATSLVSWTDDGQAVTFRFPRVRIQGQVQLDFRADIHAPATTQGLALPMSVDDTATPGAASQALWPGNADRVAGNGDDWILTVVSTPPVSIDLTPDTTPMTNRTCLPLTLVGRDASGNIFAIAPDSIRVLPPSAGTIGPGLQFCATASGTAKLVACFGTLRDTSVVQVAPELLTQIGPLALLDHGGTPTGTMTPGDTVLFDVTLSDGDGLDDVTALAFDVRHSGPESVPDAPAFEARFEWVRGRTPAAWTLVSPAGSTWRVLPDLCVFDDASTSTSARVARLAFVVGRIARASDAGAWEISASATSATPPHVAKGTLSGIDMAHRLVVQVADSSAAFSAGRPGSDLLPLETPVDARLHLVIEANAPFAVEARGSDLAGLADPGDTLRIASPVDGLHWSFNADGSAGGVLGPTWSSLGAMPAPEVEAPLETGLHLWIDHPPGQPEQDYAGMLGFRLAATGPETRSAESGISMRARVVAAGLAAQIALAEVVPHAVTSGATGQTLTFDVLPLPQGTDTGVDRLRISVPDGYGTPAVSGVEVAGVPVAFDDRSAAGVAEVVLASRVTTSQRIRVRVVVDAPAKLDPGGSDFVVVYDDESTSVPPQTASEGDANGQADENSWSVRVVPGPLAGLVVTPAQAELFRDSSTTFTAQGQDALGHPVPVVAAWRVEGGIGTIGAASGLFVATAPGTGAVIAEGGGFADTSVVTVLPPRSIAIRSVTGPAVVHQGQSGVELAVRIANTAPAAVTLDTLQVRFSRALPGDADGDFTIVSTPVPPVVLPPGATTTLGFTVDVDLGALAAPLAVGAAASGVEEGSGLRLRDPAADSTLALGVVAGGVELLATQAPGTVRPGASRALLLELRAVNLYPEARTLKSLVLANRTQGPGDADALDAELGEIGLYRDDGDGAFEPLEDKLLLLTSALDGAVTLAPLDETLDAQSTVRLFVALSTPLVAREGDVLDLALVDPADASLEPPVAFRNPWPQDPPGGLAVDGLVAAQVAAAPVGPAALHPGATDQLALDVLLPPNGYASDVLTRLSVINTGTAQPGVDFVRLRAWVDDGDGVFSATGDRLLAPLAFTGGDRWQLTGLSETVPLAGLRLFVTVDAASEATENATVKLALPGPADPGVGMASGNSGPLDRDVTNPAQLTVSNLDRVSLAALPVAGGTARPGDRGLPLLLLAATNNYATPRTLTALVLGNATSGLGTAAELDGEARLLTLRADGNDDGVLDDTAVDPVLATSFFTGGEAAFTGLDVPLAPFASRQLFVTANLSPSGARDGDLLGTVVAGPGSVAFAEPTTPAALWPLDSGARWTIDGLVAAQATNVDPPSATVGPGDGPVLALDVVVPRNGYAADVLRGLRVTNLGTAGGGDLSAMRLWRDGGDGAFTGGGDDVLLGPLTAAGAEWTSPLLAEPVAGPGARLFVSVDVAPAAAESSTVRLAIPALGVEFESGNDGPIDGRIAGVEGILISASPLLASIEAPRASTIGQVVRVTMAVRNTSGETVRGITAPPLDPAGSALLAPLSGPLPATFDLGPAAVDSFEWQFIAQGVGEVRFAGQAGGSGDPSGLPRNAPHVSSNLHRVYLSAEQLELTPVQTMPLRVNRGQADVVPFSLTLVHPGGSDASDVRVDRLSVRLEQESGAPIVPADLVERVVVNEGTNVYLVRSGLETSGSTIDLPLATPALVTSTQPATLSLRLDLAAGTVVPNFRLVVDDSTRLAAQDVTSGAPVTVRLQSGSYPVRSGVASVVAEATGLDVTALAQDTLRVGRGSTSAVLLRFRLENPGVTGISSDVRLSSIGVSLTDSAGGDRAQPGTTVTELRLVSGTQVLGRRTVAPGDPAGLDLPLVPPTELAANVPLDVALVADIAPGAPFGGFGARLLDSTRVDARDANTLAPVPVHIEPDPLRGGRVVVEMAAESLWALGSATLPSAVRIGDTGVPAMTVVLRHRASPGTARVRVGHLAFDLLDDLRRPLAPAAYLDRLVVRWNAVDVATITSLPPTGNRVAVPLPGLLLEPGDSALVEVAIDVDASAPAGFLELVVPQDQLGATDANTNLVALAVPEPGGPWPLRSGLGRLTTPAREFAVGLASRMPAVLAANGAPVAAGRLRLRNAEVAGAGPIELAHLRIRGADRAHAAIAVGGMATHLEAWVADTLWARSAPLTPDSLTAHLAGTAPLVLDPQAEVGVELRFVTRAGGSAGSLRLGVDRDDIGVVQPASALLAVNVRPEPGSAFPLWTEAGGLTDASLEASYANFPNPFAAGREATTVVYFLPGPGRVSLRILTLRGEPLRTLLDGVPRPAGLHQDDTWNGRNGQGDVVLNGVYVAELEVRFDDGTARRLRRKVAVVR